MARKKAGRRPTWDHIHLCSLVLGIAMLLTGGIGGMLAWFESLHIPDIASLASYRPAEASIIYDRHGREVAKVYDQYRIVIGLDEMPPLLPRAFIAAEDARFYEHEGVDVFSIIRALVHNLASGARRQGGSTITQQVTRALLLSPEKTYLRKFKEAVLAYRIDRFLSKNDILTIYLNEIYLGEGAYGVEAAARTYFGKSARQLSLAEVALLAGLPQAPSRYSPFKHYKLAKKRQAYVLNRMAEDGYITPTMARRAYAEPLVWAAKEAPRPENGYFLQEVEKQITARYGRRVLRQGGLRIYTTLDPVLQKAAAAAVAEGLEAWRRRHPEADTEPQAALLAIDIADGGIRAMMGGNDFAVSQFNRAVMARRQPGSAFKPFVYAAALERGYTPATVIVDEPIRLPGERRGRYWSPRNFERRYDGPVLLRNGLIRSKNVVTVKLLQEIGVDRVVRLARKCGVRSPLDHDFSLALGSSGVSLLELTSAYATFGRGGEYLAPTLITRVTDRTGRLLERRRPHRRRALDARIAYLVTDLLGKVITEGTGKRARIEGLVAAGKTGTTDDARDAWFIGYTPELACGVWMGFDKLKTLGRGETGGRAAAPLWRGFMERARPMLSGKRFPMPAGITLVPVPPGHGQGFDAFLSETVGRGRPYLSRDRHHFETGGGEEAWP